MTKDYTLPDAQPKRKLWKQVLSRLSLVTGSLIFGLLLCEVIVRLFYPGYSNIFLDIYELDNDGVLILTPNIERRHLTSEWDVMVTTNSEGLRDNPTPVSSENGTVLGVGDSMAFGWGVELSQSYHFVAEENLRPNAIRIVKAGISGTGPSDQLKWLQHYGERYNPSMVLLSFYVGNDFADVQMGGVSEQFTVRDGLMVKKPLDKETGSTWFRDAKEKLKRSSLLAQKVAEVIWYFENKQKAQDRSNPGLNAQDRWLWEFAKVHLKQPPPATLQGIERTTQVLSEIHQWCQQRQIPMVLLVIPRSFQVYDWELAKWKKAYRVKDEDIDLDKPQQVLAEWASKRGVTIVDLLPHFRAYREVHPDDRLYFYPNGHMNANGHGQTSTLLNDTLKEALKQKLSKSL